MPTALSPMAKRLSALTVALLIFLPACSNSGLNSVTGKVVSGGKGLKGAVITFHPKSGKQTEQKPSAVASDDGSFTVYTGNKPGAPTGTYTVTITWPQELPARPLSMEPDDRPRPDQLGGRYASPERSTLQATVKSGKNELPPFEVQ